MRRLLHQDLMRGQKAQRAAIILLMGLLLVLMAAFFHGVSLLKALGRCTRWLVREGAECVRKLAEAAERLLQYHPHIKRGFVFAAVDDLAEDHRVIEFELECAADGDGALEFEPNPTHGHVHDARGEADIGFPEEGDPDGLIGVEARFAPLTHAQHIGWRGDRKSTRLKFRHLGNSYSL